jgi:hypothetical protein
MFANTPQSVHLSGCGFARRWLSSGAGGTGLITVREDYLIPIARQGGALI